MNKEVVKAMNKKPFAPVEWWRKNWYIVVNIIIFPVWAAFWCYDRLKKRSYKRTEWDENRANEILNYYIPRRSEWDEENNSFYFFSNGAFRVKRGLKLKDRTFFRKYRDNIRDYLINTFELEGFDKKMGNDCEYPRTEITFEMK